MLLAKHFIQNSKRDTTLPFTILFPYSPLGCIRAPTGNKIAAQDRRRER
jgi:hypothetical protein